jgi:hypothetical protein
MESVGWANLFPWRSRSGDFSGEKAGRPDPPSENPANTPVANWT